MNLLLAAFGSLSTDNRGYRWIWHAPELSEQLLRQCYVQLDTKRFSYADELKKLKPDYLDGGLLLVHEEWCAAYRFLHGGRENTREKFYLVTAFFHRSDLPTMDLAGLWTSPAFSQVFNIAPDSPTLQEKSHSETPRQPQGITSQNFSGPEGILKALAFCSALTNTQSFHLRLTGPSNQPNSNVTLLNVGVPTATSKPGPVGSKKIPPVTPSPKPPTPKRWRFRIAATCLIMLTAIIVPLSLKWHRAEKTQPPKSTNTTNQFPSVLMKSNTAPKTRTVQLHTNSPTPNLIAHPKN
jgi:hypothetical protein